VRPVLPGLVLAIRELDEPGADALAELRRQPGVVLEEEGWPAAARAAWVRWQEVPDFFRSGPDSRHYTFDPVEGTVGFGDGRHGRIPPPGANRIRLVRLQRGGGGAGNLAARAIDQLLRPVEGVDRVFNPVPAEGGTDAEPVEEALRRGPYALRHRERAVTAEDYVRLACAASQGVARASCSVVDGLVQVLVIPDDGTETPYPGRYLVERVQSHLEARRVIGTRLRVTGPDYVEIAVSMKVALQPAYLARMRDVERRIAEALRGFVHPVHGGPDILARSREAVARGRPAGGGGGGWPLGRSLHVSELYYVVEQVEGVDYAEGIRLALAGEAGTRDKITLAPTALPHLLSIDIGQVR
jgi:predicted phage baseplate assembly protein